MLIINVVISMNYFYYLLLVFLLISCNSNKTYTYVETIDETKILGRAISEKADSVFAANDTLAYLEAFKKFCISRKVHADIRATLGEENTAMPLAFKVFDKNMVDITNISFVTKENAEKEIEQKIFSLKNSIQ